MYSCLYGLGDNLDCFPFLKEKMKDTIKSFKTTGIENTVILQLTNGSDPKMFVTVLIQSCSLVGFSFVSIWSDFIGMEVNYYQYENFSIQYTGIFFFSAVKSEIFISKKRIFLISLLKTLIVGTR